MEDSEVYDIRSEERVTRYEQVIFSLMRDLGRAKVLNDYTAYMNALGTLINMCRALGHEDTRKSFDRIDSIKARLKLKIRALIANALNSTHTLIARRAQKTLEHVYKIVDASFADVEEQLVYAELYRIGVIQTQTPSLPKIDHLLEQVKQELLIDLSMNSFGVPFEDLKEVVEVVFGGTK